MKQIILSYTIPLKIIKKHPSYPIPSNHIVYPLPFRIFANENK